MSSDPGGEHALERVLAPLVDLVEGSASSGPDEVVARIEHVIGTAVDVLRVDGVGMIVLDDHDRPRVAAATDEAAVLLERLQTELGEGPGMDTLRTGETVAVEDIWHCERYPRLGARLVGTGVRAVLSSPIRVDHEVVGNFNALARERHSWTPAQRRANDSYAGVIGLALRIAARAALAEESVRRLLTQSDPTVGGHETGGER